MRSDRQIGFSSESGWHQAITVSIWGRSGSVAGSSFHIRAKTGLNSRSRPSLANTATASVRLSSVSPWTRMRAS